MLAVIRIKGELHLPKKKKRTLELLRLFKANHLVLVKETSEMKKMLKGIETIVTFGELDAETMELLLRKRAMAKGNKRISEEYLKEKKLPGFKEIAKELLEGKKTLKELGIKGILQAKTAKKGL